MNIHLPSIGTRCLPRFGALLFIFSVWAPVHGQEYFWTTFAGKTGGLGNQDGIGSEARFYLPAGLAVDGAGNLLVADLLNGTIRRVTPAGDVALLAGRPRIFFDGTPDGPLLEARFYDPSDVVFDSHGNSFVVESSNQTIRKITPGPGGMVSTFAGSAEETGNQNGMGTAARFNYPSAIAVDGADNLYVADRGNHTIRKITPDGVVTTFAGAAGSPGSANSPSPVRFRDPGGVAVDGGGNVYVAESGNHTIRKITPGGIVSTFAGQPGTSGSSDGIGSAASFRSPSRLESDAAGNLWVTDSGNHSIRKITPGGSVTTLAGLAGTTGSADGTGAAARFNGPGGITLDSGGNVYVSDSGNHTIRKITPGGEVTTLAGSPTTEGAADGSGPEARFGLPSGIAVSAGGTVYVGEHNNHRIRKITPDRTVSSFVGLAGAAGSADGSGSSARFLGPQAITVDSDGNGYVADVDNHTIRKFTSDGVVTTFAGSAGIPGTRDGTGGFARFYRPFGAAVDGDGNIFIADTFNHTIRKITSGGVVTTFAGLAGLSGKANGTGSEARFENPWSVAADSGGNVYVVGGIYNWTVRKITPGGVVTTLAGDPNNPGSEDGTGTTARFNNPSGVAVDGNGVVYVTVYDDCTIRRITPEGVVTTIGGRLEVRGGSDGLGNLATFNNPRGIAADAAGILYVADGWNHAIRMGIPVDSLSVIERWRLLHFGVIADSGPADNGFDFDGDGMVNLIEWATGSDPKSPSAPPSLIRNGEVMEFRYQESVAAANAGAILSVEWNDGLSGPWNTSGMSTATLSDDGVLRQFKVTLPVASSGNCFFRLRVEKP